VPVDKPPTPKDSADSGDPILAAANGPSGDKPAPNEVRPSVVSTPIAGGLLTAQHPVPPSSDKVPGLEDDFSGSGSIL
jgi:hypothetical protein